MLQLLLKLPCVPFNVDVQCKKHVLRFLPRDGQYSRFSHCWVKKIVYQSSVEALWQCRPLSREIGDNTQKKETESSWNERKTELNFKFCPGDRNHPKFCYASVNFVCPPRLRSCTGRLLSLYHVAVLMANFIKSVRA